MARPTLKLLVLVAAGLLATACSMTGAGHAARGPCTLEIRDSLDNPLDPPYTARIPAADRDGMRTSTVIFSGEGWKAPTISTTSPRGVTTRTPIPPGIGMGAPGVSTTGFDVPGRWEVQITDAAVGCMHEFSIDVHE